MVEKVCSVDQCSDCLEEKGAPVAGLPAWRRGSWEGPLGGIV